MEIIQSAKYLGTLFFIPLVLACSTNAVAEPSQSGKLSLQNSGSTHAQPPFLRGVKALYNFQFDDARRVFERVQKIDPAFALAYWGEAMSYNHPLWAQQDKHSASMVLNRLAPSFQQRLAKATTKKEKAYLSAVEALYFASDDKLKRDFSYSSKMARMHETWPEDDQISVFYALSLLGTVRPGDIGYRRQALAASICLDVFSRHPKHPGAAHFIIHAFDDPDHAILALPAAKVYADIAPSSVHALHMPSHIFLQLGMWNRVVKSNIKSYNASMAHIKKFALKEGRGDFHALSWLAYANLMLGQYDRAKKNLALALAAVKRNPSDNRVKTGYLNILGRHMIETRDWRKLELMPADTVEGSNANWVAVVGMSAAHRKDQKTVDEAQVRLSVIQQKTEQAGKTYQALQVELLAQELAAVAKLSDGDLNTAVNLAQQAAELETQKMANPSGPPFPMKPASELLGDVLMAAGKYTEAAVAYQHSLNRIPKRTPSMLGLVKAAVQSGDVGTANEMLAKLRATPGINGHLL